MKIVPDDDVAPVRNVLNMWLAFIRVFSNGLLYLQYVTEKMGAAEGTKMDDDFVEMERVSLESTRLVANCCFFLSVKTIDFAAYIVRLSSAGRIFFF